MTFVVATAGHVDHGKSALVRALTGMEPDRLKEERQRGLSIELGYAWTSWPGAGDVAFVDVPGHRKFLRTTLAGLGPVPVVLLVVAADEGWRAQSAEHLAALDALGVEHGVLVITKIDRADPTQASAEARRALAGTTLAEIPEVHVCANDGSGVGDLVEMLARVLAELPKPDPSAPARLWVDRSFSISGAGQVITGTLPAGRVRVGDELTTVSGARLRVRGIESLGRAIDEVTGTARVALNVRFRGRLRAVGSPVRLERGQAVFPRGAFAPATVFDAALRGSVEPIGRSAILHIGSAAVQCRVRPLGDHHVRLTLAHPLPLHVGERALIRDPGRPVALVGLTVLDVRPPAMVGRGAARARAAELAAVRAPADVAAQIADRAPVRAAELVAMGLPRETGREVAPGWRASERCWGRLTAKLEELRSDDAQRDPLARPRTTASIAAALGLPDPILAGALAGSTATGPVAVGSLPPAVRIALEHLDAWYADQPFTAPTAERLDQLGLDAAALAAAARAGRVLRLGPRLVLSVGADTTAADRLASLPSPFRVTEACAALAASRRTVVPLLEHLDRQGWTRQVQAGRRVVVTPGARRG